MRGIEEAMQSRKGRQALLETSSVTKPQLPFALLRLDRETARIGAVLRNRLPAEAARPPIDPRFMILVEMGWLRHDREL
jgi:hypothetical protein